jgi:hypothetical protein
LSLHWMTKLTPLPSHSLSHLFFCW